MYVNYTYAGYMVFSLNADFMIFLCFNVSYDWAELSWYHIINP